MSRFLGGKYSENTLSDLRVSSVSCLEETR